MSYAVRNTIILLVTLFLFVGGAFSYIKFFQEGKLERLESTYAEKQKDYNSKQSISDSYPELNQKYREALNFVANYDKTLFKANDPDDVYDYLNVLSEGNSKVYFDFNYQDSTRQNQYGIVRSNIAGYGKYTNLLNFINKIENSQLLNKVSNLSITPSGGSGETLREVSFNFSLESYYQKVAIQDTAISSPRIVLDESVSTFNPFYPVILPSIPANEDNLINIEQSRIIGLTASRIFIIDQRGSVQTLRKGDKVYLGTLASIDVENKSATFNLNKGGIRESVTLEIE